MPSSTLAPLMLSDEERHIHVRPTARTIAIAATPNGTCKTSTGANAPVGRVGVGQVGNSGPARSLGWWAARLGWYSISAGRWRRACSRAGSGCGGCVVRGCRASRRCSPRSGASRSPACSGGAVVLGATARQLGFSGAVRIGSRHGVDPGQPVIWTGRAVTNMRVPGCA